MGYALTPATRETVLRAQKNEITEYFIYKKLAKSTKNQHNREVLEKIAQEELAHSRIWQTYTEKKVRPSKLKIWHYFLIAKIFGLTFGVKLMEKGEEMAQVKYDLLSADIPEAKRIEAEENEHEKALLNMINEDKLNYVGSMVLGLNDALVELTGALAGLTFALQQANLVAIAGLVTGVAASFSMAASEYLSTKSEESEQSPLKAAFYTGVAYISTVTLLILPYLVLGNIYFSLGLTLLIAVLIIFFFNFYISVAKDLDFKKRFLEMAGLSLGVAALSFGVGLALRAIWGIEA